MASEWTTLPLGDLCLKITDGAHSSPPSVSFGKHMASVKDLTQFGVDLRSSRYISESDFELLVKQGCQPQVGDVLIAKDGNSALDTTCLVKKPLDAVLLSSVAILRPDSEKLIPEFLKQHLSSPRTIEYLKAEFISGAAIPRVVLKDFKRALINVPPLKEQRAIAHILGTLDDKIELNRKQNETLEAMARALFKAWFVDFEPVRAKQEGRWQRGQSLPGLPAHLFDLFPERLVESELGAIPEGWVIERVSDHLNLAYGKSLPAGSRNFGNVPVYGSGGVTGFHNVSLVKGEAVIVGRKGTVGSLYWEQFPSFPIDTVFFVQPLSSLPFCYHLLESLPLRDMNTDAAVPGLNRENVYRLEFASPSKALIEIFSLLAKNLRNQIFALQNEAQCISQLRDTLLPKLISGELRVPDAELLIGAKR